MNNIIKRVWNQNRLVNIEDLTGMVFQAEADGHTFEISGVDDTGAAVELSGTVAGVFRRPDNADIALTGSASDGVVSVTLSEDCYAVPGRFGLTIFVTSNSQKVAVYACVGTVAVSSTGNVAGDTPASVEDLIDDINAAIADLNSAIGQIPASYANVMAAIAPPYSGSALYPVGAYAWYNGSLYRCITPITIAEAWTAAHWTAAVLGEDVSDFKNTIIENAAQKIAWVNGHVANAGQVTASTTRLIPVDFLDVGDCSVPSTARLRIAVYGDHYAFLGFYNFGTSGTFGNKATRDNIISAYPSAKYMRPVFMASPEASISPADILNYDVVIERPKYSDAISLAYKLENIQYYGKMAQGGFGSTGLEDSGNSLRLRLPCYVPVVAGKKYEITVKLAENVTRDVTISASYYAVADFATARISYTNFTTLDNGKQVYTIPSSANYMRILLGYSGNAAINASDIVYVEITQVIEAENAPTNGYVIGSDMLKADVYAEKIGTLSQMQSFCVYDGKYYSTDGSNLTSQDSSFAVISTASVNLGHGNSLQLGSNGKAYASGWNDNKIYIVDLATMTVDESIDLPTTGYTTAVIDDKKGLAYIFQRDTYPTTEEQYNFIVYDYINEQTIKTTKTAPFAALQSCDLYNDRIIVLNGGGTSEMPNGYKVYDTSGNVLADYILPTFSTLEPEGVCVDRNTGKLMLSFSTKDLYTISRA